LAKSIINLSYKGQLALKKFRRDLPEDMLCFDFSRTIYVKHDGAVIALHPKLVQNFKFSHFVGKAVGA